TDVGPPLHALHPEPAERGIEDEPDGALHQSQPAGFGGEPVADLARALRSRGADHADEPSTVAQRPREVVPPLPTVRDEASDEPDGVLPPVGRGHRGPALDLRVLA